MQAYSGSKSHCVLRGSPRISVHSIAPWSLTVNPTQGFPEVLFGWMGAYSQESVLRISALTMTQEALASFEVKTHLLQPHSDFSLKCRIDTDLSTVQ